MVLPAPAVSAD